VEYILGLEIVGNPTKNYAENYASLKIIKLIVSSPGIVESSSLGFMNPNDAGLKILNFDLQNRGMPYIQGTFYNKDIW
jgi:hypothetical protein